MHSRHRTPVKSNKPPTYEDIEHAIRVLGYKWPGWETRVRFLDDTTALVRLLNALDVPDGLGTCKQWKEPDVKAIIDGRVT